jgi:hypothetical protein
MYEFIRARSRGHDYGSRECVACADRLNIRLCTTSHVRRAVWPNGRTKSLIAVTLMDDIHAYIRFTSSKHKNAFGCTVSRIRIVIKQHTGL